MKIIISALALLVVIASTAIAQDKWIMVEGGNWTPDNGLIVSIQNKIEGYIINESKKQGNPIADLESYSFQYQGQEENGKQYIFINAFCEHDEKWDLNEKWDLSKNILIILDGGNCYFTVNYDQEQKVFFQLIINGEA